MATLTATRHNPLIREYYHRLVKAGKKKKVALAACTRKLLCIRNAMLRNRQPRHYAKKFHMKTKTVARRVLLLPH